MLIIAARQRMQNAVKALGFAGMVATKQSPALAGETTSHLNRSQTPKLDKRPNKQPVQAKHDCGGFGYSPN